MIAWHDTKVLILVNDRGWATRVQSLLVIGASSKRVDRSVAFMLVLRELLSTLVFHDRTVRHTAADLVSIASAAPRHLLIGSALEADFCPACRPGCRLDHLEPHHRAVVGIVGHAFCLQA